MDIRSAISNAISTLTGEGKDEKVEETKTTAAADNVDESTNDEPEKVEEPVAEDKPAAKAETKPTPTNEDLESANALNLYRALTNPETAADTLDLLITNAQKRGVEIGTKSQRQEATISLLDQLKSTVPEADHFLLDSLGPAFEYIMKQANADKDVKIQTLESKLQKFEQDLAAKEYTVQLESILSKPKYQDHLPEMAKIMKRLLPSEDLTTEEYIEEVYGLAAARSKKVSSIDSRAKKIEQNAADQMPRSSTETREDRIVMTRNPTLAEAIQAAQAGKQIKVG